MKLRNTLIMLAILIALGAFVYFYEIEGGKKREEQEKTEKKIFQLEESKVQEITLISAEGEIQAKREGSGWKIIKPIETEGEEYEWNTMARTLAEVAVESRLEGEKDLKSFGLEPPRLKVVAKAGGPEQELSFGEENPTQTAVYAKSPKMTDVAMVTSSQFQPFQKKLFDLRQKAALKFNQDEVQEITLRNPQGSLQLQKEGEDWKIKSPIQAKADKSEISSFLSGLSGAVKEFIDKADPSLDSGLASSAYDVTLVVGKDRAIKRLQIGKVKAAGTPTSTTLPEKGKKEAKPAIPTLADMPSDATFYAKDDSRPAILVVDKYLVERFDKKLDDFRDKTIVSITRDKLKKIELIDGSDTITLIKEADGSWVTPDKKKKAKEEQILSLLSAAEYNKAKRLVEPKMDPEVTGLGPSSARVIFEQEGLPRQELLLGKEIEDGAYVKLADEPGAKIVEKDFPAKFKLKAADLLTDNTPVKK